MPMVKTDGETATAMNEETDGPTDYRNYGVISIFVRALIKSFFPPDSPSSMISIIGAENFSLYILVSGNVYAAWGKPRLCL